MSRKELAMKVVRPVNSPVTKTLLKRHYNEDLEPVIDEGVKNVLVLAPHMDDETIGPGATLRKHADAGANVHVLFITDGGSSVSDLSKEELMEARRAEIDEVTTILGLTSVDYLNLPDGSVSSDPTSISYIKEKIERIQPEVIYTTPYIDAHPDHTHTAQLLADTLKELPNFYPKVRMYEINCAFPPSAINCVIDTTDQHGHKVEATKVFGSQAIAFDGFLELNHLKGNLVTPGVETAEAFIEWERGYFINHCDTLTNMNYHFPKYFKQVNRTDTLLWAIFKNYAMKKDLYRKTMP
ncbi:PIG-L family deacetylase [Bacillus sp. SB49]|uniref:PIG-L deacetylase family protein n=1 Tax=Bacillus sp. SB49 TaxID=1071080 RepID=UPI00041B2E48|nr:PIG-L deacetylase family protein [Bacillus sp. SB49]QHT48052.1 PIG-L family deacetylase [Bacillus sp. SB49]